MKKLFMSLIAVTMMFTNVTSSFAVDYGEELQNQPKKNYTQTFSDVSESYWAFPYIEEMVERGVLSGYPNGKFYPYNNVSRAEFAKIMVTSSGTLLSHDSTDSTQYFQDVPASHWAHPYISSAMYYLTGYNTPYGNYYYPDQPALREDIAVALVKLKGYDLLGADESILTTMFTDASSISSDAKKYVAVAVERGLISGYEDNTFKGQSSITRAEAATLLWRAYQYGNDNKFVPSINNDDLSNTNPTIAPITEPVEEPTPKPIKTPRPVKTPEPTEEPTPTPEPTEEPTPTPIPATEKPWEIITIDDAYLDDEMSHEYMTYDSNNNYVYYYDQRKNYINIYDVDNDKIVPYIDCSSLYIIEDTNEVVTEIPPTEKGNYYKNIGILEIEYDNYAERLYVKVIPGRLTDIGGLSDKYVSGGWEHVVLFYIDSNRNISNSYYCGEFDVYGICEQGIISPSDNMYKIFDRETYEELYEIPRLKAINSSVMVSSDKWYLLRHVNGDSLALCSYDYQQLVKMRDIGRCEYCAMNSNNFYGWDMDRRIIRCDLNGNLSILVDIDNDIKIKDMRPMKITSYNHSEYKMIVTDDENNIIFADDTHLRVIRRVG